MIKKYNQTNFEQYIEFKFNFFVYIVILNL